MIQAPESLRGILSAPADNAVRVIPPALLAVAVLLMLQPPPGLVMILGAVALPLVNRSIRDALILLLPLVTLMLVWRVDDGVVWSLSFLDYTLEPVRGTAVGRLFATVFSLMAFTGGLYAHRHASTMELTAAFIYAGSAIGVTFAGDLLTLFIYWELMALGSTVVIIAAGTASALRAARRYVMIHLLGGVILMVGITGHVVESGSLAFVAMQPDTWAKAMILAGLLVNAGAPPWSAWIADAYPEASPSGAVFLSAFTTKTAVFTLLVGFPGAQILVFFGLYMVFYGIIYALLENDMRRILAYSIVNQVGFMVTGIGIGTPMALNGASAHAFAHIIYKALLLMSAGAVLHQTGKRKCTDLGGLFQSMPITTVCGTIGALAISAFPFTSGFVSKSMINQASADTHMVLTWFLLTAATGGVFLHAGIKFPWFVFFQKDSGMRPPDPDWNMRWAMYFFSFMCLWLGMFPGPLYAILPYTVDYAPYTAAHLVSQFQLLLFAGLAFFVMLPAMKRTLTISLDLDWFYRRLMVDWGGLLVGVCGDVRAAADWLMRRGREGVIGWLREHHGPSGWLARSSPTGIMVLWVALILVICLFFYYTDY